ncbi:PepSY domain-containing protein [Psychrobacter aquimaris]|uniref:PepSY domain-containing protein n=1 Tax=Psychrobacter aquimaris TaxID=292733 RepID=UPI003FD23F47
MSKIFKSFSLTTLGTRAAVVVGAAMLSTTIYASASPPLASEVQAAKASKISLQQAINIAAKKSSGLLMSASFDHDDDKAQGGLYEIEFITSSRNYEIKVDATTGKVISTDMDRLDSDDMADYKALKQAKIDVKQAMKIAEKQTGGRVIEIEFKNDRDYSDHASYYEADILKGNSIVWLNIDANTGSVFKNKFKK